MRHYKLLSEKEAKELAETLKSLDWQESKKEIVQKSNLEIYDHPELKRIMMLMRDNTALMRDNFVQNISLPMFSRYQVGAKYGSHNDAPIIRGVRTDMAFTLFLNEGYEGGELCVNGMGYRGTPGTVAIYECWKPHSVAPILEGERICAVGWIQSLIRSAEQRELLNMLSWSVEQLEAAGSELVVPLSSVHARLFKNWTD